MTTEPLRLLAVLDDGVPPCGRVLVRTGRVAVIECTDDELASLADGALVWSATAPEPAGLPVLDEAEREFVAARVVNAFPKVRPRDGAAWDSDGAVAPDPPK